MGRDGTGPNEPEHSPESQQWRALRLRLVWVFIDDSGDAGFKFGQGSTNYLVLAAVVFREREDLEHAISLIEGSRFRYRPTGQAVADTREYKFSKTSDERKRRFFKAIEPAKFHVRAIVIDKRKIYSGRLRENPSALKSYMIHQMLTHHFGQIQNADLIIDGQDTRAFEVGDREYFMRVVNQKSPGTLKRVQFVDSQESAPIQLADMVAGAIRKSLEGCKKSRAHWDTFRPRGHQPRGSIWYFK